MDVNMRQSWRVRWVKQACTWTPGYEAAAVQWRIGRVQPAHFFQRGPCTLAGFGNSLQRPVYVLQGGLTGEQGGGLSEGADRWWEWQMGGSVWWDEGTDGQWLWVTAEFSAGWKKLLLTKFKKKDAEIKKKCQWKSSYFKGFGQCYEKKKWAKIIQST